MAKVKNETYRAHSKMVHIDCLFSISQVAIILKEGRRKITGGHKAGTLPFVSFEIGKTLVFYIPASALRAIAKVHKQGVTKTLDFYRSIRKNHLLRLFEEDIDWEKYNLDEWK